MWELDHKEGWVPKNWCFLTTVLEKTLESPLDCKEIQPVHPKKDQSWIFFGRTGAEAEAPLWPPDVKSQLIRKDPDSGKDRRQEENGMTKGEMVGLHHHLNGQEFEKSLGDGEGQGSLACCSPWGHKELDTTEQLTTTVLDFMSPKSSGFQWKPQWGTTTCQSGWLLFKSLQAINAGEGVEKREPSYNVGGKAH